VVQKDGYRNEVSHNYHGVKKPYERKLAIVFVIRIEWKPENKLISLYKLTHSPSNELTEMYNEYLPLKSDYPFRGVIIFQNDLVTAPW